MSTQIRPETIGSMLAALAGASLIVADDKPGEEIIVINDRKLAGSLCSGRKWRWRHHAPNWHRGGSASARLRPRISYISFGIKDNMAVEKCVFYFGGLCRACLVIAGMPPSYLLKSAPLS